MISTMSKKYRITLWIIFWAVCTLLLSINAHAYNDLGLNIVSNQISPYQGVIDRLNEEYGYNMQFDFNAYASEKKFNSPLNISIEEFEANLRRDIEKDIEVNQETKTVLATIGEKAVWEDLFFSGNTYKLPVNVSYMSKNYLGEIISSESFSKDLISQVDFNDNKSTDKTLSSIQPKKDPTGNIAILINSTISIDSYWSYTNVASYSNLIINDSYPRYVSHGIASRTYRSSNRQVTVVFNCNYYNENGVLVNSNSSVSLTYTATGDCITNSPNYTINTDETNKTYNHISNFDSTKNCAGYAWQYNAFVGMSELGITYSNLANCSNLNQLRTLVKNKSESYMLSHSITATEISSYNSSINPTTQYRVVMRVGYYDDNGNGVWDLGVGPDKDSWDYHWWMQLGDGSWADKRGGFPSRIIHNTNLYADPDTILWSTWDFGEPLHNEFYSSTPVYYKITG